MLHDLGPTLMSSDLNVDRNASLATEKPVKVKEDLNVSYQLT